MGRRWWAWPGLGWAGPAGPTRPISFSEDGPRPAQPITVSNIHGPARRGPSNGSEVHETRALYRPAQQLHGPARGFDGPAHGPAHVLSRTKRCMFTC